MEPFIHEDTNAVVLEKVERPLCAHDVVLYKIKVRIQGEGEAQRYILHRIIGEKGDNYIILGDNCTSLEYVRKDEIIAVMRALLREGEEVDLGGLKHRLYMRLWVRPWRMRVRMIKLRGGFLRGWWKFVEIAAPYTPRPIKEGIKRLIGN